jgi:hypothetical protein
MAGRKIRCVALGTDWDAICEVNGDPSRRSTVEESVTYEMDNVKFEIFFYWPGCGRTLPRPMDFLMILLRNSEEAPALKECYDSFKNVVFKVVVGKDPTAGIALAGELNAKWMRAH